MPSAGFSSAMEEAVAKAEEVARDLRKKRDAETEEGAASEAPSKKKTKWDDEPESFMVNGVHVHIAAAAPGTSATVGPGGEEVRIIFVPQNAKGSVIGKGGETINRIRAESQAHVTIKQEEGEASKTNAVVTIKGSRARVAHAEALVQERMRAAQRNFADWEQRIVEVPKDCIGETIGQGGCNLQVMSERSGCKVRFVQATEVDPKAALGNQVCVIRGPPSKINAAELLVKSRVIEVQELHLSKRLKGPEDGRIVMPPPAPGMVPPMLLQAPGMVGGMAAPGVLPMGQMVALAQVDPMAHWYDTQGCDPWGDDPTDDSWENWILPFVEAFQDLVTGKEVEMVTNTDPQARKHLLAPSAWIMPEYRVIEKAQ